MLNENFSPADGINVRLRRRRVSLAARNIFPSAAECHVLSGGIPVKKLIIAIVVAYLILMGTNYLIHRVWLMPDYDAIPLSHRSIVGIMRRFWAMALGQFFFAALFSYIYTRGIQRKPWLGQGFRYGILMAFFTVIPFSLSEYDTFIVPYRLAIKWMFAGGIQMIILGIVVAAICQESSPPGVR
jgi:hypothetical protein